MPPKSPAAASAKERGNIAFKDGRMEEAAKLYRLAESKDSSDHTYPGNLSAALYEIGDYCGCFEAICRARSLYSVTDVPFLLRLSMRLAKCLVQGERNGTISDKTIMNGYEVIEELKGLASSKATGITKELQSAWKEWDLVLNEAPGHGIASKRSAQSSLARMDFRRQPLRRVMEFFYISTDETMSIAHGWGRHEAAPLNVSSYSDEQLSNISFMLAGFGDGRHLLGTLIGLTNVHRSLSKRQKTVARFHLTALDIHPAIIARNLVFLFLLDELVNGQTITPEAKAEVIATYMYALMGVVMPDYCHKRLMAILYDLCDRFTESPPRLPSWIFIPITSIPPVLGTIHYWIESSKTTETETALKLHNVPDMTTPTPPGMGMSGPLFPHPGNAVEYGDKIFREFCAAELERMTDQQLVQLGLVPGHLPSRQVRQYFERHKSQVVELAMKGIKETIPSASNNVEAKWYKLTKTLPIPKGLEQRHPALKQLLDAVRQNKDIPRAMITKAQREIKMTWKPNLTFYCEGDQLQPGIHKGYPVTTFDIPSVIYYLRRFDPSKCSTEPGATNSGDVQVMYDWTSRMLSAAANTLVALKGSVKVEMMCAELFSELQLIRSGEDHHRPKEFPRSFLRVWTDNIPDYTHGVINVITQVLPILQTDNEEAAVALCCGLNGPVWANNEQFVYTYTLLQPHDIPRFLGCRIITGTPVSGALSIGRLKTKYPLPPSKLAARKELTHWLSTQLINILVPGNIRDPGPSRIRFANNPVALFRSLLYLHSIGYPSHWLSEFLQSVLWNDLTTEAVRAKELPIPISHATEKVNARKVDLAPWVPEFEMILASTRVGLPFHVRLPEDFATTSEEIETYEANYHWSDSSRHLASLYTPFDHMAMLVFWRSDSIIRSADVSQLIMASISEKGRINPRNDLVVVNCLEGLDDDLKVRWKLAKKRVDKMKREGDWQMAVFRSDFCAIVSEEIPSPQWREISPKTGADATPSYEVV